MPPKKGNKAIVIYFPPDEWEIVCKKAKAANLKNGTYIRVSALKTEIKIYNLQEILALKRSLVGIGKNVNQVAANVNRTGSVYKQDIEDLQKEFKATPSNSPIKSSEISRINLYREKQKLCPFFCLQAH